MLRAAKIDVDRVADAADVEGARYDRIIIRPSELGNQWPIGRACVEDTVLIFPPLPPLDRVDHPGVAQIQVMPAALKAEGEVIHFRHRSKAERLVAEAVPELPGLLGVAHFLCLWLPPLERFYGWRMNFLRGGRRMVLMCFLNLSEN